MVLDTATTPELEAEGLARDVIRAVQDARRSAGLDVSDRIDLRLTFQAVAEADAVAGFSGMISDETLATAIEVRSAESAESAEEGWTVESEGASHQAVDGEPFRSVVPAGRFANEGAMLVELSRQGTGTDGQEA